MFRPFEPDDGPDREDLARALRRRTDVGCSRGRQTPPLLLLATSRPTTFLAQRRGAHVLLEIGVACTNIEIFCEDARLRVLLIREGGWLG
eukprot:14237578-Alexandrium_andersonii.AAC.1